MKKISVQSFKEVVGAEEKNSSVDFINVCTPAEYDEKYIPGVRSVPLDEIHQHLDEFKDKKTIYVHCRSGRRGEQAIQKMQGMGIAAELINVDGGIMAWDAAGFPTASNTTRMPIMRQTMLAAGLLVLTGSVLSHWVSPFFGYLSMFVGAGLTFAGLTGWCGMSLLLARMPWNR